jgi:hypothetical protein
MIINYHDNDDDDDHDDDDDEIGEIMKDLLEFRTDPSEKCPDGKRIRVHESESGHILIRIGEKVAFSMNAENAEMLADALDSWIFNQESI